VGNVSTVMQVLLGDFRDTDNQSLTGKWISPQDYLEQNISKIVYVVKDPADIPRLRELTDAFASAPLMQQTLSSPIFLECYDKGAGKDSGVRIAMELAGMTDKTLVCIGDFYNDVPMLRIADIAACPANAPDDIKAMCQIITCSNNDGALADLIEVLEKM
jgi:hydroxymethylpyrimidine pyrophosphatase-like HAD family hydrolase